MLQMTIPGERDERVVRQDLRPERLVCPQRVDDVAATAVVRPGHRLDVEGATRVPRIGGVRGVRCGERRRRECDCHDDCG